MYILHYRLSCQVTYKLILRQLSLILKQAILPILTITSYLMTFYLLLPCQAPGMQDNNPGVGEGGGREGADAHIMM